MYSDAECVAGVEAGPADRTQVGATVLFGGEEDFARRTYGVFFPRDKERCDLCEAEAYLQALRCTGEGIGRAAKLAGDIQQALRRVLPQLVAAQSVKENPAIRANIAKLIQSGWRDDEESASELDGCGLG
jgi:hypothetical protein